MKPNKNAVHRLTPFFGFIFRYLSKSLAKCECKVNCNFLRNNFKYASDVFEITEKFKEIIHIGNYIFEYINSHEKINDAKLPSIYKFYSSLTGRKFLKMNI